MVLWEQLEDIVEWISVLLFRSSVNGLVSGVWGRLSPVITGRKLMAAAEDR